MCIGKGEERRGVRKGPRGANILKAHYIHA